MHRRAPRAAWCLRLVAAGEDAVRRALPTGRSLPPGTWVVRHHGICVLLWLHALGVPLYGVAMGEEPAHALADGVAVGALALGASTRSLTPPVRSAFATLGLLASSVVLIHLSGGLIEMHFHVFVMVVVISLYQSWVPFLLALGAVTAHHGMAGLGMGPAFNHPAALAQPWRWALVHGLFIVAQSLACIVAWRANEDALGRAEAARGELEKAHAGLAEAQALARVGSWEWDADTGEVVWSAGLHHLTGVPTTTAPTLARFFEVVHVEDRARLAAAIEALATDRVELDHESRVVRPDGTTVFLRVLAQPVLTGDGRLAKLSGTCQDVSDRKAVEAEMERRALHDPLTGVGNRTLLLDRLRHAVAASARSGAPIAILYLDLDEFKAVNDTLGHGAGDELLVEVAGRVAGAVRTADTVARLGGDEFAVLLEGADEIVARAVADGITLALRAPVAVAGSEMAVSTSIGIATGGPGTTAEDLLRDADTAMYATKRAGKTRARASAGRHRSDDDRQRTGGDRTDGPPPALEAASSH